MRRRDALSAGAAALAVRPSIVVAQSPMRPRIGLVSGSSEEGAAALVAALRSGLAERGYREPATIELLLRFADGNLDRLPLLVRNLIAADVKILVTSGVVGARAAREATQTLPIVIAGAIDVLESGLVVSLARPGTNVTGLTQQRLDTAQKEVELLTELVPHLTRLAVLIRATDKVSGAVGPKAVEAVRTAASPRGIDIRSYEVATVDDVDVSLHAIARSGAQAIVVVDAPLLSVHLQRIAATRLPVLTSNRAYVDAGALASFGASQTAIYQRVAYFIDRILKGAKPADLPVEQPTKFELVINLKSAKALGLAVPPAIFARADEVIE